MNGMRGGMHAISSGSHPFRISVTNKLLPLLFVVAGELNRAAFGAPCPAQLLLAFRKLPLLVTLELIDICAAFGLVTKL